MANTNTNVTISFTTTTAGGGDAGESLKVDVVAEDQTRGDTNFIFGDTAKFRVYKSSGIASISIFSSDGVVSGGSSNKTATKKEMLTFTNSDTASTSFPVTGSFSMSLVAGVNTSAFSGAKSVNGSEIKIANVEIPQEGEDPIIGIYTVTYQTSYTTYSLSGVSEPPYLSDPAFEGQSYPVSVYLIGDY